MDYQEIETKLKFDENGLIPAIVQDYATHEVLTLAYMNRESLQISLARRPHLLLQPQPQAALA